MTVALYILSHDFELATTAVLEVQVAHLDDFRRDVLVASVVVEFLERFLLEVGWVNATFLHSSLGFEIKLASRLVCIDLFAKPLHLIRFDIEFEFLHISF